MKFQKVYESLIPDSYFTTVWCTLENRSIDFLHQKLEPLQEYMQWLSTYGDIENNPRFRPHITLRYLGHTKELDIEKIIKDKGLFKEAVNGASNNITLGKFSFWEKKEEGKVVRARINWEIVDDSALTELHNRLLEIPAYYFFKNLEGNNYHPHISLGEVNLLGDNYEKVKNLIEKMPFEKVDYKLENFAINIPSEGERKEIYLSSN